MISSDSFFFSPEIGCNDMCFLNIIFQPSLSTDMGKNSVDLMGRRQMIEVMLSFTDPGEVERVT